MARRNDHTREQIKEMALTAAEEILQEDKLDALTARKIAAKMDYTVGTLYLVFENLDDLILNLNARTLSCLIELMQQACREGDGPEQRLARIATAYVNFAHEQHQRWTCLYSYRNRNESSLPHWYLERLETLFKLLEAQLSQLNPGLPAAEASLYAKSLWCGVHGVCVLSVSGKLKAIADDSALKIVNHLVNTICRQVAHTEGSFA